MTGALAGALAGRCGVVVPVKPGGVGKSRLAELGDEVRRELAAAFAVDTVAATLACPVVGRVLVVTDDLTLVTRLRELGAEAIPDGRPGDLNETLRLGAAELHRVAPTLRPVALCGDLPALRAAELEAVLAAAPAASPAFVADAAGVGSTLYCAPTLSTFTPSFGDRSRHAHLAVGTVELDATDAPSVRRDVDTAADLAAARRLGVGAATAYVLTARRL